MFSKGFLTLAYWIFSGAVFGGVIKRELLPNDIETILGHFGMPDHWDDIEHVY